MLSNKLQVLEPFIGIWNTQGEIRATGDVDAQIISATDTYEWQPGDGFLLHRVDALIGKQIMRSLEVIGWDEKADGIFSTSYDDKGTVSHFTCRLDGRSWAIDGDGMRFRGAFNENWMQMSGTWEMNADGKWKPWIDIKLIKAVQ